MTLETYSQDYGNYVYAGLPLRDRKLSTWRDQDGNVILGALGCKTPRTFFIRFLATDG